LTFSLDAMGLVFFNDCMSPTLDMNNDDSLQDFPLLAHRQERTLEQLKAGEIENVRVSASHPVDQIVLHALREGLLQQVLRTFPDPRNDFEVPIEVLLLPQILQRLNNEHSLLLAPYMLNNAELIEKLGYNAKVLESGFNERNTHPRETLFHGETLKHLLLGSKPELIVNWFNHEFSKFLMSQAPGRTRQYILDGTKIEVPEHLAKHYQKSGMVEDSEGKKCFGYKIVWLQEIIDRKGIIVALKIVPIERHDVDVGRELVATFPFEKSSTLLMDRGFIDGEWITHLKQERGIDVVIPLKKNMYVTTDSIALANERNLWKPHPTREGQQIAEIGEKPGDLVWKECPVLTRGVLCRWFKKDGTPTEVLFVTTHPSSNGRKILASYDQRSEIEESSSSDEGFSRLGKTSLKKMDSSRLPDCNGSSRLQSFESVS
jgi:Transposase DDE domain